MNVVRVNDTIVEAREGTIDIDGVPCDLDKVKDGVRRCVAAAVRIREYEHRGRGLSVEDLCWEADACVWDVKAILKGEDAKTDTD